MFRPWDQDPRPTWWVRVQHTTAAPLTREDADAVKKVLADTGMVRQPTVVIAADTVIVWMVVRADSAAAATQAGSTIVAVAHRESGHGLTLRRLRRSARPHRHGVPSDE